MNTITALKMLDQEVALAPESDNLHLLAPVPDVEQPKAHIGDSYIRAHSCDVLYPHIILYRGKLDELKRNIIIEGKEFPCPDMPIPDLKKWADEFAREINSGKILGYSELCKPIVVEHFRRLGYDTPLAELAVMRHRQQRGYYLLTFTQTVENSFKWSDTLEGSDFWRNVSCGEIKKLAANGKHLPIDPRVMAVLFTLQYEQNEKFERSALVNTANELHVKMKIVGGVDLSTYGLADLYTMLYYAPTESLMAAVTNEFLKKAYKHLTK